MQKKALEIYEQVGWPEGMASAYVNLGLICETRGDLDQAEAMQRKYLEVCEHLGKLMGMANVYGNLGLIYMTRGDLDRARRYWTKSMG